MKGRDPRRARERGWGLAGASSAEQRGDACTFCVDQLPCCPVSPTPPGAVVTNVAFGLSARGRGMIRDGEWAEVSMRGRDHTVQTSLGPELWVLFFKPKHIGHLLFPGPYEKIVTYVSFVLPMCQSLGQGT